MEPGSTQKAAMIYGARGRGARCSKVKNIAQITQIKKAVYPLDAGIAAAGNIGLLPLLGWRCEMNLRECFMDA
jgi:hypothetical protein